MLMHSTPSPAFPTGPWEDNSCQVAVLAVVRNERFRTATRRRKWCNVLLYTYTLPPRATAFAAR